MSFSAVLDPAEGFGCQFYAVKHFEARCDRGERRVVAGVVAGAALANGAHGRSFLTRVNPETSTIEPQPPLLHPHQQRSLKKTKRAILHANGHKVSGVVHQPLREWQRLGVHAGRAQLAPLEHSPIS